jgi:hypothetical protein
VKSTFICQLILWSVYLKQLPTVNPLWPTPQHVMFVLMDTSKWAMTAPNTQSTTAKNTAQLKINASHVIVPISKMAMTFASLTLSKAARNLLRMPILVTHVINNFTKKMIFVILTQNSTAPLLLLRLMNV